MTQKGCAFNVENAVPRAVTLPTHHCELRIRPVTFAYQHYCITITSENTGNYILFTGS